MLNKNRTGLIFGVFLAIIHAVWALGIAVARTSMQSFLDWVFKVHFLEPIWKLTAFNLVDALLLIVLTFIAGYIFGWVFACIWNLIKKK